MSLNIVIIGANKGIGLSLCQQYMDFGNSVTGICRTASQELKQSGCDIIEDIDITDDAAILSLPEKINTENIDILIHNSGILHSDSYTSIDLDNMREHFEVNSLGPLRTIQALECKLRSGSKVGIVSSRVGSIADNSSSNNYAYRVSKTAVNMIGKCLSIDLAPKGIAVALLHPGYVKTSMTDFNGLIDTEESAAGLIKRMDELTLEDTGIFVHTSGERLPW